MSHPKLKTTRYMIGLILWPSGIESLGLGRPTQHNRCPSRYTSLICGISRWTVKTYAGSNWTSVLPTLDSQRVLVNVSSEMKKLFLGRGTSNIGSPLLLSPKKLSCLSAGQTFRLSYFQSQVHPINWMLSKEVIRQIKICLAFVFFTPSLGKFEYDLHETSEP